MCDQVDVISDREYDCTLVNLKLAIDVALADQGRGWPVSNEECPVKDTANKVTVLWNFLRSSPLLKKEEALSFKKGKNSLVPTSQAALAVHSQQNDMRKSLMKMYN